MVEQLKHLVQREADGLVFSLRSGGLCQGEKLQSKAAA